MSVLISISDDGRIEATHNSGRVLWLLQLDDFAEAGVSEDVADWVREAIRMQMTELGESS